MTGVARHLSLVSEDAQSQELAAIDHAWRLFLRRYTKGESRRTMLGSLQRLATTYTGQAVSPRAFPWHWLVNEDLAEEVWAAVRDKYSKETAKKDAAALKSLLRCYYRAGLLTESQYRSAVAFETRIKADDLPPVGRTLTGQELHTLFHTAMGQPSPVKGVRDGALILTLASTGARRHEVSHLQFQDIDLEAREAILRVTKTGAVRKAWLHPNAIAAVKTWTHERGHHDGPLFHPLQRDGQPITERALSSHQIWKILSTLSQAAGTGVVTPHDLRRFAVSTLLDQGIDLPTVSRVIGHKSALTTIGYDRRPEARCRDAVDELLLPPAEFR